MIATAKPPAPAPAAASPRPRAGGASASECERHRALPPRDPARRASRLTARHGGLAADGLRQSRSTSGDSLRALRRELGQPDEQGTDPRAPTPRDRVERGPAARSRRASRRRCLARRRHRGAAVRPLVRPRAELPGGFLSQGGPRPDATVPDVRRVDEQHRARRGRGGVRPPLDRLDSRLRGSARLHRGDPRTPASGPAWELGADEARRARGRRALASTPTRSPSMRVPTTSTRCITPRSSWGSTRAP